MRLTTLVITLLVTFAGMARAQQEDPIYLASDTVPYTDLTLPEAVTDVDLAGCTIGEFRYLVARFASIPTPGRRSELSTRGVTFLSYLPEYAYLLHVPAGLPLAELEARAFLFLRPEHKFSARLAQGFIPAYAKTAAGWQLSIFPYAGIEVQELAVMLKDAGFLAANTGPQAVRLTLPPEELNTLAAHPAVGLLDLAPAPPIKEGLRGRTSGRVNRLSAGPASGLDGEGVALAIADDGPVDHIDFTGRLTDWTDGPDGNHGDMTAGLAAGAGNLAPLGMGMAPAADLFLYSILQYPHIQQAAANYQDHQIVITSTSFGEGCGGWYGPTARNLDAQVLATPPLFHSFSAGNSSAEHCSIYGNTVDPDGVRYGNITGGRKAAKHSIAVANLRYDDRLHLSSSRGPTYDGRIKPDISAHGQGNLATGPGNGYAPGSGTSAAAPTLAGTTTLLYQAFRESGDQQDPPSALIKAAILNSAEDLGRPGPDYDYGWGRVHAARALETLSGQQYLSGTVGHGAVASHTITVPAGVREVRVMAYWPDPPGAPNAAKALVNDLDLSLQTPEGATLRPWVLSAAPQFDSLTRPAWRGYDRRNNMEQVSLLHPAPGTYQLDLQGYLVPEGPQSYFLVYTYLYDELTLTYPAGGEGFVPGETETIRWDAAGTEGSFELDYSLDSLATWLPLAAGINGRKRHYDWPVPPLHGKRVFVRVRRAGQSARSDSAFTIVPLPAFDFTGETDTSALIHWPTVPGATAYDVYRLGDRFMEVIGHTTGNCLSFSIVPGEEAWLSVRARGAEGGTGRRAVAKKYRHQSCDAQVTLTFQFDQYPGEIKWEVRDLFGGILAAGGPYNNQPGHSTLHLPLCLPTGCYALWVYDLYGDGLCCENGEGGFQITDAAGNVLLSGGTFGDLDIQNFCVAPVNSPLGVQLLSQNEITCAGGGNGSALVKGVGGTGNYTYTWSDGQTGSVAAGLAAGEYTVTVTDGNDSAPLTITIDEPGPLEVNVLATDGSCLGEPTGTAEALFWGGTPPYYYLWSTGETEPFIEGLSPGNYSLTVIDAYGCEATHIFSISATGTLTLTIETTDVSCNDGNDGTINVSAHGGAGPYLYQWAHGPTKSNLSDLTAGTYEVTVTDPEGCLATTLVTLTEPEPLALSLTAGPDPGSVDLSVTGGTPPYTYNWSNGSTAEDPTELPPGEYAVTVTDAGECTAGEQITIEDGGPVYCPTGGASTSFEWIESIALDGQAHQSGNDGGYGNHTNITFELTAGNTIGAILTPGQLITGFPENWRLWIDLNQDGDFSDDGELMIAADQQTAPVEESFVLPADSPTGLTRLRVAMQYGSPPPPCGSFGYGEAEDYMVEIQPPLPGDDGDGPPPDDPPLTYCDSKGQSSYFEWIEGVMLGDLNHVSGNDGGYADFTGLLVEATAGQSLPVELTPGFQGNYFGETWRIWADFNQDGDFEDDGELLFSSTQSNTILNADLPIPANAASGPTRLRITMKWGALAKPCELYNWGETEDYTLVVLPPGESQIGALGTGEQLASVHADLAVPPSLYPNPTEDRATLRFHRFQDRPVEVRLTDPHGRPLWSRREAPLPGRNEWTLPVENLPPGTYFVQIFGEEAVEVLRLVVK